MKNFIYIFLSLIFLQTSFLFGIINSQPNEYNIVPLLKKIEDGKISEVKVEAEILLNKFPNDPSIIFLNAILNENGEDALKNFQLIFNNFPKSNYADASMFRAYSYYYSLGAYKRAGELLERLKSDYPTSPYIRNADRDIPDEEDKWTDVKQTETTEKKGEIKNFNFTIQVGAFTNVQNAKALMNDLDSEGYEASSSEKNVGGTIFTIVYAGKFVTRQEANLELENLKNNLSILGHIVPIEKEDN